MSNYMKKEYTSPAVIKTAIASQSTILAGSIGVSDNTYDNDNGLGKGNNGDDEWDDDNDGDQGGPLFNRTNLWD